MLWFAVPFKGHLAQEVKSISHGVISHVALHRMLEKAFSNISTSRNTLQQTHKPFDSDPTCCTSRHKSTQALRQHTHTQPQRFLPMAASHLLDAEAEVEDAVGSVAFSVGPPHLSDKAGECLAQTRCLQGQQVTLHPRT